MNKKILKEKRQEQRKRKFQRIEKMEYFEAYNTNPEKFIQDARRIRPWDARPFFSDGNIFFDLKEEDIEGDIFDGLQSSLTDVQYRKAIRQRCLLVVPVHENQLEGQAEKFDNLPMMRQIREDCVYSNGQIRVPQLIKKGACSIPSHLRIDNLMKFVKLTIVQAEKISRMYRVIGVSFKIALKINNLIRKRTCKNPWDIKINKAGLTLVELADSLEEVDTPGVEVHLNNKIDKIKHENKYISIETLKEAWQWGDSDEEGYMDDIAVFFDADSDPVKEAQEAMYKQSNTVGEYTYLNISALPKFDYNLGKRSSQFRTIMNYIKDNKENISLKQLKDIKLWIKRKCTWSQKTKFNQILQKYLPVKDPDNLLDI